jgi:hypothetical protein
MNPVAGALARYQDAFAAALVADDPLAEASAELRPLIAQPGFSVYRNTVMKGCIDALQSNYPTIERLVGEEWFRAAAACHARKALPSQSALIVYGETFADFLATFEPARELPYLADVARLDRAWTEAHVAADARTLEPAELAALPPAQMSTHALRPHPATRWCWSDEWPIHMLWSRNRGDSAPAADIEWIGEGVLLTRPAGAVESAPLGHAGAAFLSACAAGASIERAVARALDADGDVDIAALIRQLLEAGAFSELQPALTEESR